MSCPYLVGVLGWGSRKVHPNDWGRRVGIGHVGTYLFQRIYQYSFVRKLRQITGLQLSTQKCNFEAYVLFYLTR
jgi:hypothetical protein